MGGGTGTGATPVFAEVAKELGILTVAVVTKPFMFEGRKRMTVATEGIKRLTSSVDSLITIPNNKLLPVLGKNVSLLHAFKAANNVLLGAVQGIAELITKPGLINVDFADVRTVMAEMGMAMMGTANARGEGRARNAAEAAISSPLLEDVDLSGAGGVLVNITAGPDMSIGEFEEVGEVVKSFTSEDAVVVLGTVIDPNMADELRVTVVVTGLGGPTKSGSVVNGSIIAPAHAKIKIIEDNKIDDNVDYRKFDKPSVLRGTTSISLDGADNLSSASLGKLDKEVEYLDIPAFLRREDKVRT
jgi:cell division protein FtsZ